MTDTYIEKFKQQFAENIVKVIPKTIIEKVGNISNLRKIVIKCMEQLYLEQNIID